DLLVAVSSAEGRLAVASGAITQDRLRVVENAVQRPIAIGPRPTWGAPRTFGFIGELREQKAPLIFIEAAAALVATGRHARFILPKRGCQLRAATRLVRSLGIGEYVQFVPECERLTNIYAVADVLVLPSLWECLPYALLDGLALAKPVVTSDLEVFRDTLGDAAPQLTATAGSVESLSERLCFWADAPGPYARELGASLQAKVVQRHSLDEWVNHMCSLYELAYQIRTGKNGKCRS